MAHLVTGYKGAAHITPADDGAFNAALIGTGDYVLPIGEQFKAQIITNNSVRIFDGNLVMQGRHVNIPAGTYEDVTIANGAQDTNRNDLVVMRYTKDMASGIETATLAVIQGTAVSGTASDPSVTTGDILVGTELHEMPLYRVKLNGLTVESVTSLFSVCSNLQALAALELAIKALTENLTNHGHDGRYYTELEIDRLLEEKANSSHGTHVSYTDTKPVMDGTASVGSAETVARSDHKHPSDTSRVAVASVVNNFTTTAAGYVADARAIKTLSDRIDNLAAGKWTATKIIDQASGFSDSTTTIAATSHDFIIIETTMADHISHDIIPLGIVGVLGSYEVSFGYSSTSVKFTFTTTSMIIDITSSANQTQGLKVYYLDRK